MWTKSSSSAFPRHLSCSWRLCHMKISTIQFSCTFSILVYIYKAMSFPSLSTLQSLTTQHFSLSLSLSWPPKKRVSSFLARQLRCMQDKLKKIKIKKIRRRTRGRTRSYRALDARAWRPNFVTSTTIMLTSLGTSARAARDTGRQVGLFVMFLLVPVAVKPSHQAVLGLVGSQKGACMMAQVMSIRLSWIVRCWLRSGTWLSMVVSGMFSR